MAVSKCKECGRTVIRLSWSQLRTAAECKQKRFLRVTGVRKAAQDQRLFLPGNVTDRVVRQWLKDDPARNVGVMPDMVNATIDSVREEILARGERITWKQDLADRENVRKDCIEAVTKIEPLLLKHVVPFEYEADFRFDAPLRIPRPDGTKETLTLIGLMDILVRSCEGLFSFLRDPSSVLLKNTEFLEWLKTEKFDVAFTHMYNFCPIGIIHVTSKPTHPFP